MPVPIAPDRTGTEGSPQSDRGRLDRVAADLGLSEHRQHLAVSRHDLESERRVLPGTTGNVVAATATPPLTSIEAPHPK